MLEKRIDKNEDHLDMLMQNDKKQDETLAHLEASLPNLDGKLKALESADEFFQVVYTSPVLKPSYLSLSFYLVNLVCYLHIQGSGLGGVEGVVISYLVDRY